MFHHGLEYKIFNVYSLSLHHFHSEFSLARYNDIAVYTNNSVIDFNLVGEGFEGLSQITDGGALECHTDDITCCRGKDNPPNGAGQGEWYYPNGTPVLPPDGGTQIYRTRGHMVIRLNRIGSNSTDVSSITGVYRCEIPGAAGVILRYITLRNSASNKYCLLISITVIVQSLRWCT